MTNEIRSFTGKYYFLSNFYPIQMRVNDYSFPSLEHAYQAAKSENPHDWAYIRGLASPGQAKGAGRRLKIRPDWDDIKIEVMRELIEIKFNNPQLRQRLLDTGDAQLVEGNNWNDVFWGVCRGIGRNHLGQLLMQERSKG
jgi:ribA/ribD-fused uncharacterized protein